MELPKPIKDHLPSIESEQQTSSQSRENAKTLTERHIQQLWLKMTEIYGHKWTSSFGEKDQGTWLRGLQGLAPDQLAAGLGEALRSEDPWPPTLPQFYGMCKPRKPSYHRPFKRLPPSKKNVKVALDALQKMKDMAK